MGFQKAVKRETKGRVALVGPAGSGKSYTMLLLARALAGADGRIAAIDTEHGSLSKYADQADFDVAELASFSHETFLKALHAAEEAGYAVFCCDSISHFWMGKDGALEFVDTRSKKNNGDSFSGWKDFRPHERAMIDAILASPLHVIVTMRTKNEYVTEKNDKGKTVRRKIGLAPVQREGIEYEFDLVGTLDDDNTLIVDKTRCSDYAGKALAKPGAKDFRPFIEWLKGAPPPVVAKGDATDGQGPAGGKSGSSPAPAPAEPAVESPATVHSTVRISVTLANPEDVPVPLRPIIERLLKDGRPAVREALDLVKRRLVDVMPANGEDEYKRIVQKHELRGGGPKVPNVIKAILEMWQLCEFAAAHGAGFHATDDDLPEGLFPGGVEKEPTYAHD